MNRTLDTIGTRSAIALLLCALTLPAIAESVCERAPLPASLLQAVIEPIVESGYATGTTTNQARFVADFLFALAEHPAVGAQGPFWINPADFLVAWQAATDTPDDAIPAAIANVRAFDQRFYVAPLTERLADDQGSIRVRRALAVRVAWSGGPERYEYIDRMSDPHVRMRHQREIDYLLLETDHFIAYEHVRGVAGQPITGALGALFGILGMAQIESTRLAIDDYGTQVNRTQVRKLFEFETVTTIAADGQAQRGLPSGRADLAELADQMATDWTPAPVTPPGPCR
ncbi:MAG: hypothetical protein RQ729_07975 [Wenzhouxiangellaceae bacterium]|nr:hypothetical protein [Wenzhouxiangellaceae bacterium]